MLLALLGNVLDAIFYPGWRKRRSEEIIESYRLNALKGLVPPAATNAGSIRPASLEARSPFHMVIVTNTTGARYVFGIKHVPDAPDLAGKWHFRLLRAGDADGTPIASPPDI